jgi:hypothetical protein
MWFMGIKPPNKDKLIIQKMAFIFLIIPPLVQVFSSNTKKTVIMNQFIVISFHDNGSILANFYSLFFAFCKQE